MKHIETKTHSFVFNRKELIDMIATDLHNRMNIDIPEDVKGRLYAEGGFIVSDSDYEVSGFNVSFTQEVTRGDNKTEHTNVIDEDAL